MTDLQSTTGQISLDAKRIEMTRQTVATTGTLEVHSFDLATDRLIERQQGIQCGEVQAAAASKPTTKKKMTILPRMVGPLFSGISELREGLD